MSKLVGNDKLSESGELRNMRRVLHALAARARRIRWKQIEMRLPAGPSGSRLNDFRQPPSVGRFHSSTHEPMRWYGSAGAEAFSVERLEIGIE